METGGTTNGLEKMILKNRLVYLPVNSGRHKRNISIRKATREIESYVYSTTARFCVDFRCCNWARVMAQ